VFIREKVLGSMGLTEEQDSSNIVNIGEAASKFIDAGVDYERLIPTSNLMKETTGLSTFHFFFKQI